MNPAPGVQLENQPAAALFRMLAWGEARGEKGDAEGRLESVAMAAVLFVVLNRVARGKAQLRGVILQPFAFSCFNPNDPNRNQLIDAHKLDPISWERADTVADLIESGWLKDPTGGATHYCTVTDAHGAPLWGRATPPGKKPQWYEQSEIAAGRTVEKARFGHHVFAVAP